MNLINPYKLLGITVNSTSSELKKNYYNLAKICHPDKGGNSEDMCIIYKSYKYVEKQFENCKNIKSYDEYEKDFEDFCKKQTEIKLPAYNEIYKNSDEYLEEKKKSDKIRYQCEQIKKERDAYINSEEYKNLQKHHTKFITNFNKKFDEEKSQIESKKIINPFDFGYGEFMDISDLQDEKIDLDDITEYNPIENLKNKNKFTKELVIYKEPLFTPLGYGKYFDYTVNHINDFSDKINNIQLNDYKLAFSNTHDLSKFQKKERTYDDIIKEREDFMLSLQKN